ncbi:MULTISPECIES: helix-turn-helix domain-containing protein [Heyndrickxia]|uniref:helix-turn-helix domain-containing protein n=1 Tax=Heyndrickxia TaxID=2837504 RepID=UPI001B11A165|nr:helix-turn-helix transcriptional regulator [Heyndrickxia oleronia]GIN41876.1 transcriptional regulator [Heyndrickxia oleronia]
MLGERIRKLRKQKKMTLESLAGEGLTKGMLSLIENNKAKPSIESLAYIAERLGVETADLLEEMSVHELREILEQAETLYNWKPEDLPNKYIQLIELIEPYISNLNQGYESARLLDIYCRCLYFNKRDDWQSFSEKAAQMYDQINLTGRRANLGIFRSMVKFTEHDYKQSLKILLNERKILETQHAYIDPMTILDLDYHEAILHFAVDDLNTATKVMEKAIQISKKYRTFYRIDDLYRLASAHAMMSNNKERIDYYLMKLKQYGDFADDIQSILSHDLVMLIYLIKERKDYTKVLDLIERHMSNEEVLESFGPWMYLAKGEAMYGFGRYQEAIDWLDKVEVPSHTHHPFDLAIFYEKDSYKALCYIHLKKWDQALLSANQAMENFNELPHSPFKEFSLQTLKFVQAEANKHNEKLDDNN